MKILKAILAEIPVGGRKKVQPDDIIFLEGKINYTLIFLADGSNLFVATTLKQLQKRLSFACFFRVHKSQIVNLRFVEERENQAEKIFLSNGVLVKISRRKKTKFLNSLKEFGSE